MTAPARSPSGAGDPPGREVARGAVPLWNIANNAKYITAEGSAVSGLEVLTPVQQLNEYIMISLRTSEGCSLPELTRRFGPAAARQLENNAAGYILTGKMTRTNDRLQLTREGKLLADGIAAELFFEPTASIR